jgi:hypothetical protein
MVVPGEFSVQVESWVFDMVHAGKLHVVHVDRRAHSSTCGERNVDRIECVGLHARLVEPGLDCVWSFWEAMEGSLSEARMAVSSAKVAVEVGRSAVSMRYRNGPRTLPWGTPAWIGDRGWWAEANLTKKCLFCRKDRRRRK